MNLAFGELTSYLIGEIGGSAAAHLPLARGVYGEEYDLAAGPEHAGKIGEVALGAGVGVRLEHGEHSAAVLFRGGKGAFEFGGMVSVVKDDLRAPEFACPLAAALNSFERSKSAASGVQVGAELTGESDGERRVLGVVSARERQSEHLPPVRGGERHRLPLSALRNTRKEVCTLVHPRVLPFRNAHMRTRAYESVLSPHQGERTFFDKFRKDLPHLADVAVAVRVIALDVDDGGDVGLQRGEMPPELARFGEEYPSRQRAVFAAA